MSEPNEEWPEAKKLRVPQLREHLRRHRINFPERALRQTLVDLYNKHKPAVLEICGSDDNSSDEHTGNTQTALTSKKAAKGDQSLKRGTVRKRTRVNKPYHALTRKTKVATRFLDRSATPSVSKAWPSPNKLTVAALKVLLKKHNITFSPRDKRAVLVTLYEDLKLSRLESNSQPRTSPRIVGSVPPAQISERTQETPGHPSPDARRSPRATRGVPPAQNLEQTQETGPEHPSPAVRRSRRVTSGRVPPAQNSEQTQQTPEHPYPAEQAQESPGLDGGISTGGLPAAQYWKQTREDSDQDNSSRSAPPRITSGLHLTLALGNTPENPCHQISQQTPLNKRPAQEESALDDQSTSILDDHAFPSKRRRLKPPKQPPVCARPFWIVKRHVDRANLASNKTVTPLPPPKTTSYMLENAPVRNHKTDLIDFSGSDAEDQQLAPIEEGVDVCKDIVTGEHQQVNEDNAQLPSPIMASWMHSTPPQAHNQAPQATSLNHVLSPFPSFDSNHCIPAPITQISSGFPSKPNPSFVPTAEVSTSIPIHISPAALASGAQDQVSSPHLENVSVIGPFIHSDQNSSPHLKKVSVNGPFIPSQLNPQAGTSQTDVIPVHIDVDHSSTPQSYAPFRSDDSDRLSSSQPPQSAPSLLLESNRQHPPLTDPFPLSKNPESQILVSASSSVQNAVHSTIHPSTKPFNAPTVPENLSPERLENPLEEALAIESRPLASNPPGTNSTDLSTQDHSNHPSLAPEHTITKVLSSSPLPERALSPDSIPEYSPSPELSDQQVKKSQDLFWWATTEVSGAGKFRVPALNTTAGDSEPTFDEEEFVDLPPEEETSIAFADPLQELPSGIVHEESPYAFLDPPEEPSQELPSGIVHEESPYAFLDPPEEPSQELPSGIVHEESPYTLLDPPEEPSPGFVDRPEEPTSGFVDLPEEPQSLHRDSPTESNLIVGTMNHLPNHGHNDNDVLDRPSQHPAKRAINEWGDDGGHTCKRVKKVHRSSARRLKSKAKRVIITSSDEDEDHPINFTPVVAGQDADCDDDEEHRPSNIDQILDADTQPPPAAPFKNTVRKWPNPAGLTAHKIKVLLDQMGVKWLARDRKADLVRRYKEFVESETSLQDRVASPLVPPPTTQTRAPPIRPNSRVCPPPPAPSSMTSVDAPCRNSRTAPASEHIAENLICFSPKDTERLPCLTCHESGSLPSMNSDPVMSCEFATPGPSRLSHQVEAWNDDVFLSQNVMDVDDLPLGVAAEKSSNSIALAIVNSLAQSEVTQAFLQRMEGIADSISKISRSIHDAGGFPNQFYATPTQRSTRRSQSEDTSDIDTPRGIKIKQKLPRSGSLLVAIRRHCATLFGRCMADGVLPPPATEEERRDWVQRIDDESSMQDDCPNDLAAEVTMDLDTDPGFPYPGGPGHAAASPEALRILWSMMRRAGIKSFRPDLGEAISMPHNQFLWNFAARSFLKLVECGEYEPVTREECNEELVQRIINNHVTNHLMRIYREQHNMSEDQRSRRDQRRRRTTRRATLREWRIAEIMAQPVLAPLMKIVETCCSDDETDAESMDIETDAARRPKNCVVLGLPWRHPRILRIMMELDRLRSDRIEASGPSNAPPPRNRKRVPNLKASAIKHPAGLPIGCYNLEWLSQLSPYDAQALNAPLHPTLNHYVDLLKTL